MLREHRNFPFINNLKKKIVCLLSIFIVLGILLLTKKVIAPRLVHAQVKEAHQEFIPLDFVAQWSPQTASSTFDRIPPCESMGSSTIRNAHSTASGWYQFLDSSWHFYGQQLWGSNWVKHNKLNQTDSTILAAYVYGKNGTADWSESRPCWSK